jgi:hypothetical protein
MAKNDFFTLHPTLLLGEGGIKGKLLAFKIIQVYRPG